MAPRKKSDNRLTNPGIYISAGQIEQSDFDKNDYRDLMQDYTSMRNDDSIASSSVDILIHPIFNSKFTIKAGYKEGEKPSDYALEVADYVMENYYGLESGLKYYIRHKLLALYYGFAMFEKIWKKGDIINGKIGNRLVDMYPIQQDTIYRWLYDDRTNFLGIEQEQRKPERGFDIIKIDAEYLHIYTPYEEFKNPQGRSLLRPSRLAWKIKRKVWEASGRAACRGAGIPEFKFTPTGNKTTDDATKSTLQTMAKNIGNSENAYVLTQTNTVEFELHSLQNQEMNIPLIKQANDEMFYNTLSEFAISGIGGNGSRAATGEHKSPYYEAIDAIISTFEDNEDQLIEEIIENSPYAGKIDKEEMPYCVLERPKSTDVIAVGNLINTMIGSRAITKTAQDEVYIRSFLGLPEMTEEEINSIKEENQKKFMEGQGGNNQNINEPNQTGKENNQNKEIKNTETQTNKEELQKELSVEPSKQDLILESANAEMVLQNADMKANQIIDEVYQKILDDIAIKLEKNPNAEIKLGYKKELIDRLSSVFNSIYKHGQVDIRKEYAKIAGTQLANLTPIIVEGNKDRLVAKVDTLYSAIENSIKDELLLINKQNVENAGGMNQYIKSRFGDTQKKIKSDLAAIASQGYFSGRHDQLSELEKIDPELKRMYLTDLEDRANVCSVCLPLTFMTMNKEEANTLGLNWDGTPVNPLCLGQNNCRCTWRPAYQL